MVGGGGKARRGEEQDEEANVVKEVHGVGVHECGVVPRRCVHLVVEVEEQRKDWLRSLCAGWWGWGSAARRGTAWPHPPCPQRRNGGEVVQEHKALGGDNVVIGPREAAD